MRTWQPTSGSYAAKLAPGGGLTVCGLCGKELVSQRHRGHTRLICLKQATGGCGFITINYKHLEEFVLGLVWEALDTPDVRAGLSTRTETTEDAALRAELQEIERQLDRAFEAFTEGIVDKDRYLRIKTELDERAERLEGACTTWRPVSCLAPCRPSTARVSAGSVATFRGDRRSCRR
ncbi:zinc ribbon domain-containing protein [Pseudonocardia xinjiangensis]|uniref:zinc ribbon domain-containing protein n=1 Tax=Pseudonocardia xinjiangensis TaxID=75289 RepID=UPI003D8F0704